LTPFSILETKNSFSFWKAYLYFGRRFKFSVFRLQMPQNIFCNSTKTEADDVVRVDIIDLIFSIDD